ncbi:ketopantoate reductase family protein [Leifsonia sp. ZF2019]|uniref:ketopantoate reductase family protein n=1 Tax=Leifsonia sp. ZF2019 TaxID=2781978 RepID=UPI001CBC2CAD|nr:2-dehydropantoate 2-reductase N-terminal domain-containing protein [Leifsonia sp. ZF2019]
MAAVKVLMFGRGVIASIYGWALEQAGHEVEFLVRPGRAAAYGDSVEMELVDRRRGSGNTQGTITWSPRYREELVPDDGFDVVVLSVGHHALGGAADFLAPRIGNATVLVFGNVWEEPLDAVAPLPAKQLVWGFPQAGGGFDAVGVLHGMLMRRVVFGPLDRGRPSDRERAVRDLFASAGLTVGEQQDIRGWLLAHFVADVGMHAAALRVGSLSAMIEKPRSFREAFLISRELLPVLRRRGVDLRGQRAALTLLRRPSWLMAAGVALATSLPLLRVSLAAHTDALAAEPVRVVLDALAEARRLGVPVPRLERAAALIPSGVREAVTG